METNTLSQLGACPPALESVTRRLTGESKTLIQEPTKLNDFLRMSPCIREERVLTAVEYAPSRLTQSSSAVRLDAT